ncbi:hypothetical protein FQA39_LY03915 [Lamprigera yunnana]|nr:hypothetical protein FQA39_LY03915 [Lamprigera yunnana]
MLWFILISVIFFFTCYKVIKPLSYWKDRDVVHEKPYPLIGGMANVVFQRKTISDHTRDLYKKFIKHRYFGFHQFNRPVLYIRDLDLIKKIAIKDFDHFIDHNTFIPKDVDPLMEKNLLGLKGQRWRDVRATLSPSFTISKLKFMFTLVSDSAQDFINYFKKENEDVLEIEMKDAFTRFTNDTIASVAFGLKCNSLDERTNEFFMMGKMVSSIGKLRFFIITLYTSFPILAKILKVGFFPSSVSKFFYRIVRDAITLRESEGLIRPDMIQLLLEARKEKPSHQVNAVGEEASNVDHKNKLELTDEDITAQALLFFLGGFETVSTLLSFLCYELALNYEIQAKLQKEIDKTLVKCNGKLTYEALHEMKYLDMVVSETIRKWPTGFQLDRVCVSDYKIEPVNGNEKSLLIEKGTLLIIPVVGLHHDPKYFPNPEKFEPERFSEKNKSNFEPSAYLPFGLGPRICIASRFALMEMKILIFHLFFEFEIIPISKTEIPVRLKKLIFNLTAHKGFCQNLIKKRSSIKGLLTRFVKYADQFKPEDSIHELTVRIPIIKSLYNEFEEIQCQIELSRDDDAEDERRVNFERDYFKVLADIEKHKESKSKSIRFESPSSKTNNKLQN